ncbi:MAG: DUF4097 family beta strand repeat-containing protein [Oscillospiraceae bacterium]|nr:DUF4097 family beta strand repeat-containing protein [Oscillospiraceae bacterium]
MSNRNFLTVKLVVLIILLAAALLTAFYIIGGGWSGLKLFSLSPSGEELSSGESFKDVSKLDIDLLSYSLDIVEGEGDETVVSFSSLSGSAAPLYTLEDGVLSISEKPSVGIKPDGKLILSLPRGLEPNIDIDSASGSVSVKAPGSELDIDTTSGSIKISAGGRSLKAASVSGSITIDACFETQELESVSGSIKTRLDRGTRSIDAESASGSLRISVSDAAPYTLDFESISGSVRDEYSGMSFGSTASWGGGGTAVSAETISGSIRLCDWSA